MKVYLEYFVIISQEIKREVKKNKGITIPELCKKIDNGNSALVREIVETLDNVGVLNFISNRCYYVNNE